MTDITGAGVSGLSARNNGGILEIYYTGAAGDTVQIANGTADVSTSFGITAGTYYVPALSVAPHTSVPAFKSTDSNPRPTGSVWLKTTEPNLGAKWSVKKWNDTTKLWETVSAPLHSSNESALFNLDKTGGGAGLAVGDLYINYGNGTTEVDHVIFRRESTGSTKVTGTAISTGMTAGSKSFTIQESIVGQEALNSAITVTSTLTGAVPDADVIAGQSTALDLQTLKQVLIHQTE